MRQTKREPVTNELHSAPMEASEKARLKSMLVEAGIPQRNNVSADQALTIIQQGAVFFMALALAANGGNAKAH